MGRHERRAVTTLRLLFGPAIVWRLCRRNCSFVDYLCKLADFAKEHGRLERFVGWCVTEPDTEQRFLEW